MTDRKTKLCVFFGGRSPEHDVSIITGLQALGALDPERFEAFPLYIAPNGAWLVGEPLRDRANFIPAPNAPGLTEVTLKLGAPRPTLVTTARSFWTRPHEIAFDVAFLAFHGLIGEDGGLQGLLEAANIPYTGMRLLASSVLMDKAATKRMLAETGVPVLPFHEIRRPAEGRLVTPAELQAQLGNLAFPACLKPTHLGSSIGVAQVKSYQDISDVLTETFRFDDTAMVEPFVENLVEYNVAVTRTTGTLRTSAIERPKRASELLDFKTKYCPGGKTGGAKGGGSKSGGTTSQGMLSLTRDINPALPPETDHQIRAWAATVFDRVAGTGAPRLDFLCNEKTGEIWFNEANPCPGSFGYFLWEAAAEPLLFTDLLAHLIAEAKACHAARQIPADPTPKDARLFPRP
jgi:D-alanine-D-alanine ligase